MYQDIGLRNFQAIERNGFKLVKKMQEREETKHLATSINDSLKQIETLFKAANIIVNR